MGCIFSTEAVDDGAFIESPYLPGEINVFVPGFREPRHIDLVEQLQGSVSAELATRLQNLRSQVIAAFGGTILSMKLRRKKVQQSDPGGLELEKALNDYLPLLLGFVTEGEKLSLGVEFTWTNVEDEKQETALASVYYELLSVLHLLGMLALQEANACLTPKPPADAYNIKATEESKRNAIEILLKSAAYFECAINSVLPNIPEDIKAKLPADLTEGMLKSLEHQALGQGVELQLGFAIDNVKASLAVKRRLACEQVEVWDQAIAKLACVPLAEAWRNKHVLFLRWKLAEAKAAAYYFHGVIVEEGEEDNAHAEALSCLKTAHKYLKESQKARSDFGNMEPLSKVPPLWGPMKYLAEKIPREALSKGRIFRDNYSKEKLPATTPKLPEFPLALQADQFVLPPVDSAWKKEPGYEVRLSLTQDATSFLGKRDQAQSHKPASDLRRAGPMSPPMVVSADMLQAR